MSSGELAASGTTMASLSISRGAYQLTRTLERLEKPESELDADHE